MAVPKDFLRMDNAEMIPKGKECDDVEWIPVAEDGVHWWVLAVAD